jgi:DNA-binding MarR family transcriptional regulator
LKGRGFQKTPPAAGGFGGRWSAGGKIGALRDRRAERARAVGVGTAAALGAVMHFLAFQFKRAHYTALRISRPIAAKFGLTPARVDMLYAIKYQRRISQAQIARALGVSGVTVSRMLRKLEGLGLVQRATYGDKRMKSSRLTRLGRRGLFSTLGVLKSRLLQRKFMRASLYKSLSEDAFLAVDDMYSGISEMMKRLGDRTAIHYPTWHPDD